MPSSAAAVPFSGPDRPSGEGSLWREDSAPGSASQRSASSRSMNPSAATHWQLRSPADTRTSGKSGRVHLLRRFSPRCRRGARPRCPSAYACVTCDACADRRRQCSVLVTSSRFGFFFTFRPLLFTEVFQQVYNSSTQRCDFLG